MERMDPSTSCSTSSCSCSSVRDMWKRSFRPRMVLDPWKQARWEPGDAKVSKVSKVCEVTKVTKVMRSPRSPSSSKKKKGSKEKRYYDTLKHSFPFFDMQREKEHDEDGRWWKHTNKTKNATVLSQCNCYVCVFLKKHHCQKTLKRSVVKKKLKKKLGKLKKGKRRHTVSKSKNITIYGKQVENVIVCH